MMCDYEGQNKEGCDKQATFTAHWKGSLSASNVLACCTKHAGPEYFPRKEYEANPIPKDGGESQAATHQ
jgi:hypothetical protein